LEKTLTDGIGADAACPVLVVMDVQSKWMPMMSGDDARTAPDKINEAIALFRELGFPIVTVYHSHPKRGPEQGTEAFAFPDWVAVTDDGPVIVKSHPSSFKDTALDDVLKESDRNVVFLCGLSATGCVLATYFGALDRDYMTFMVEEALLSHDSSYTDVIEKICYSMPISEIETTLRGEE
jgi:nicotinamidase-related amidase